MQCKQTIINKPVVIDILIFSHKFLLFFVVVYKWKMWGEKRGVHRLLWGSYIYWEGEVKEIYIHHSLLKLGATYFYNYCFFSQFSIFVFSFTNGKCEVWKRERVQKFSIERERLRTFVFIICYWNWELHIFNDCFSQFSFVVFFGFTNGKCKVRKKGGAEVFYWEGGYRALFSSFVIQIGS